MGLFILLFEHSGQDVIVGHELLTTGRANPLRPIVPRYPTHTRHWYYLRIDSPILIARITKRASKHKHCTIGYSHDFSPLSGLHGKHLRSYPLTFFEHRATQRAGPQHPKLFSASIGHLIGEVMKIILP